MKKCHDAPGKAEQSKKFCDAIGNWYGPGAEQTKVGLLTVQGFTSQRAGSLQDITGLPNFLGL